MTNIKSSELGTLKPNEVLSGLPDKLKDPAMFTVIERKLAKIIKSDHKHKTAKIYVKCAECQEKRQKRLDEIKALGFKNIQQYLEWKKIHYIIKNKQDFRVK